MSFFDDVSRKVKAKAEEWDVQGKAERFAAEVDKAAHDAKDKTAEYADDNRGKIRDGLDKVGAKIDEQTEGKYADKVARAKDSVSRGVDKVADQRPGGPTPPSSPAPGATASQATPGYTSEAYRAEPYTPDPIDPAAPIDLPVDEPHPGTGWPQDTQPRP